MMDSLRRYTCHALCLIVFATACKYPVFAQSQSPGKELRSRYLYLLNCSALMQKIDATTGRLITRLSLASRSPEIPTHGDGAGSVPDGCATYGVAYQPESRMLYTLSPTTGSSHEGVRRFRVLSFHVPALQAEKPIDLPGVFEEGDEPSFVMDRAGRSGINIQGRFYRIEANALLPEEDMPSNLPGSLPVTADNMLHELDLSAYHLEGQALAHPEAKLAYHPLERSGNAVLLASSSTRTGTLFAVVDTSTKRMVPLNLPFRATERSIHLAPGGKAIVAQEASLGHIPGSSITSGKMALLNANTGAVLRSFNNATLAGTYSLTITSAGQLVVFKGERTRFISLGLPYSLVPVLLFEASQGPWFFYADR